MKLGILLSSCCLMLVFNYLFLMGCGYRVLPGGNQTIAVPIFNNKTIYHGHEFDLTRLVQQRILAQTPFLLIDHQDQADFLLSGEISDYTRPALIEASDDQVIVSQVAITLKIVLTDLKSGKVIYQGSRTESGSLISIRDQTEISARAEAFNKLSGWVVASLATGTLTSNSNK